MAEDSYLIRYRTEAAAARRETRALINDLIDLDRVAAKAIETLARLGKDTSGIGTYRNSMVGLAAALKAMEGISGNTKTALGEVGKDTGNMTRATTKANSLNAALQTAITTAANGAPVMASFGSGMGGPGGGGGRAGGGGLGGTVQRAVTSKAIQGAFGAIRKVMNVGGDAAESASEFTARTSDAAADFRSSLREVAGLEGKKTVDDQLVRDQLKFIEQTGASPQEALEFRSVYKGAVGASILRHQTSGGKLGMSADTANQLMPEALKFANRTEMDGETAAKLFGLLGEYQGVPNAEAAMRTAGAMQGHLNILGVGTMKQLGSPFFGLMGEMTGEGGRVSDPVRLAATFAAETVRAKSPAIAATEIRQANRGLVSLIDKGDFGITGQDDYTAALRKANAKLQGLDRNSQDRALSAMGIGNALERSSMIKQMSLIPTVDAQMQSPEVARMSQDALKLNQEYMTSDVGKNYTAEARLFKSEIERGMEFERIKRLRTEARARMNEGTGAIKAGTVGGEFAKGMKELWNIGSGESGETMLADTTIMRDLIQRGKKVGYDVRQNHPDLVGKMESMSPFILSNRGFDFEEKRRTEISKIDEIVANLEEAAKQLGQAGQQLNQQGRAPGNAGAVPGRP